MRAQAMAIASALLIGCASPPPVPEDPELPDDPDPPSVEVFDAPKDVVWAAVVEEIGQRYPIESAEQENGVVTTSAVPLSAGYENQRDERWVHSPGGYFARWHGLRVSMEIRVDEALPGKTAVAIQTHFEAFEENVAHTWAECVSNGSLEQEILSDLALKFEGTQEQDRTRDL